MKQKLDQQRNIMVNFYNDKIEYLKVEIQRINEIIREINKRRKKLVRKITRNQEDISRYTNLIELDKSLIENLKYNPYAQLDNQNLIESLSLEISEFEFKRDLAQVAVDENLKAVLDVVRKLEEAKEARTSLSSKLADCKLEKKNATSKNAGDSSKSEKII